jgi:hypothetical protein
MSSKADKGKMNPWDLDLRVRERNLANGTIDQKAVDKHLHDLPDLESEAETLEETQPALGDGED